MCQILLMQTYKLLDNRIIFIYQMGYDSVNFYYFKQIMFTHALHKIYILIKNKVGVGFMLNN
jgi:hypothetical protein